MWEIPVGKGRRWLSDGGVLLAHPRGLAGQHNQVMSGVPLTVLADGTKNGSGYFLNC